MDKRTDIWPRRRPTRARGASPPFAGWAREPAPPRFEREARLLAAINHPAIGAIYGAEEFPNGVEAVQQDDVCGTDDYGRPMWSLVCDPPNQCKTGPAIKGSKGGYWKTDQILPGKPPCDAGIIIQP